MIGDRMFGNKELQILFHMSQGKGSIAELSECLGTSAPETYRKIRMLRSKGIV